MNKEYILNEIEKAKEALEQWNNEVTCDVSDLRRFRVYNKNGSYTYVNLGYININFDILKNMAIENINKKIEICETELNKIT